MIVRRYFICVKARLSFLRPDRGLYDPSRTPLLARVVAGRCELRRYVHHWHQDISVWVYPREFVLHRGQRKQPPHMEKDRSVVLRIAASLLSLH